MNEVSCPSLSLSLSFSIPLSPYLSLSLSPPCLAVSLSPLSHLLWFRQVLQPLADLVRLHAELPCLCRGLQVSLRKRPRAASSDLARARFPVVWPPEDRRLKSSGKEFGCLPGSGVQLLCVWISWFQAEIRDFGSLQALASRSGVSIQFQLADG